MNEKNTITAIEIQKKNKNRYAIFIDGEFAFGIDAEVLVKYGLARGAVLTREKIDTILLADERKKAKNKALRLLSVRARSRKELYLRLQQAGFAEWLIESVLADLERVKLIDDREFALSFSRSIVATKKCGELLIRRELQAKGIADEFIEAGIAEAYKEVTQFDLAFELASKKKQQCRRLPGDKTQKRVIDLLARRGFRWELVGDILNNWESIR